MDISMRRRQLYELVGSGRALTAVAQTGFEPYPWEAWCRQCHWSTQLESQRIAFRWAERHVCRPVPPIEDEEYDPIRDEPW
jgi:hypothetical protein